jgi:glycosyltransferase involved in cell wall biosynthesis
MRRSLRIAMALPGLHRVVRGAETALEQIARELARLGHEVTLFGSGQPREGEPYQFRRVSCVDRKHFENWPKLPVLRSQYAWEELTFSPGLWLRYHPDHFDVTMACSYPFTNWILRSGAVAGNPKHVFITQNGDWMLQSSDAEFRFFDCDGLVCTNSQFFARHGERFPSALIPNGVDAQIFHPGEADRSEFGLPQDGPIALTVSALIPSKRVIEAVRAAARVPGLFLVVAGDGPCRDEVDEEAGRLLAGRYLRLTLPREKMPGLYRCADVLLHMSREDPSANAYTEALASGLPIVTHNWEVTQWTLEDCAFLVDCQDEAAVAGALARALEAKSADAVSHRCELAQRRFAWSSIGGQYSDFLEALCSPMGFLAPMAPARDAMSDVGVVIIGRNEGPRLTRCLTSVLGRIEAASVVYVDSGSTDQSVTEASKLGVQVVEMDRAIPFTAARARNAGVQRLREIEPHTKYIQFVDGDCEVRPSWLDRARRELDGNQELAAVCGRRRERFPHASVYHRLIDMEWDTPVGEARSVGGDAMFRLEAFNSVNGFDPGVMAGEEPELCMRLRHSGWKLRRIADEMTLHDAAMKNFSQWWKRQVRGGYGALDVHTRFVVDGERLFTKPTRSARIWAIGWPVAVVIAALIGLAARGGRGAVVAGGIVLLAIPVQIARLALSALRRGRSPRTALQYGILTMVGKWAWLVGQMRYRRDRAAGKGIELVEYKGPSPAEAVR